MNNKILVTCILLAGMSFSAFAQPTIGGIKNKIKNKAKEEVKDDKSQSDSKTDNSNQDEPLSDDAKEKAAIGKSPASSELWDFRHFMKGVHQYSYGPNCGSSPDITRAGGELENAKLKLDKAREKDPDFKYLAEYTEKYKKYEKRHLNLKSRKSIEDLFSQMNNIAEEFNKDLELGWLNRNYYDSLVVIYQGIQSDSLGDEKIDNFIIKLNHFFITNQDKNVSLFLASNGRICRSGYSSWSKSARSNPDWEEKFSSGLIVGSVKGIIEEIKNSINSFNKLSLVFPRNVAIKNHIDSLNPLKADLELFESSGELDELIARVKARELAAVRMEKPGMKDPSIESLIKTELKKKTANYNVVRVVITSENWSIGRNSLGIIINKVIDFEFAFKDKEGNCYIETGNVVRDYNGSSYENMRVEYYDPIAYGSRQIHCDNIFK